MSRFLGFVIGIIWLSSNAVYAQGDAAGAKEFGVSLVQAFYDNQCSYVFDHLDKKVTSLQGGQELEINESMRGLFCEDMPVRKDISNSYTKYTEQYQPQVYNHKTFKKQFPAWAKHIQLQPGDFFFDGAHPRAAGHTRLFTSEHQVRFIVRYQEGNWVIIGF
jgi:hypothetical protein